MAPAIVHFLVGASVMLLVAAPIVLRYECDRRWGSWLVPVGGIWGLLPDGHNVTPVFRDELYAIHGSPLVDLCGFHYTLDTPPIRALPNESTFASIVLCLLAVGVFSVAQTLSDRTLVASTRLERGVVAAIATLVGAGYGATAWGLVVRITDGFRVLAALAGQDSLLVGWVVLVGCSLAGGSCLAAILIGGGPRADTTHPLVGALVGILFGFGIWIVGAVVVGPLWLRLVVGASLSVPHFHWSSLVGLLSFGAVFGVVFALIRGAVAPRA